MNDSTVYVVQEDRGKNLTGALRFGNLEAILAVDENFLMNPVATAARMANRLRGFSDNDFILPVGDPVAIGIACAVAAEVNGGRFKVLKWDRQERLYYPVAVDLSQAL